MTTAEVRSLFESRLQEGIPNPPGEFHPNDLDRLKDERYLNRLLAHADNDIQKAANMLWDIFIWRKTVGANDFNETNLRMDYLNKGIIFPHGRDIDGCLILIVKSKNYIKGQIDVEELKKITIYWLDRVEREENGRSITIFFDMEGCGISNMDIEFIKYIISLFQSYYPHFLNYIIVFQLPWILSAAFRVIKALLPAKAVEILKNVTKDTLKTVVSSEQALTSWGGKDDYVFEFVPENKEHTPAKKVTFAEQDSQHSPGEMLRIVPNDLITFKQDNDETSTTLTITNMEDGPISFKIRTTSPEKFRVRPSSGVLGPNQSQIVLIVVLPGFLTRTVTKDKFLIMSVPIPKIEMSTKELAEIWHNTTGSKVDEYRLRCQFPESPVTKNGDLVDRGLNDKADSVTNALNNLQMNYEMLNKQVVQLKMFQFVTVMLTALAVLLGYLIYKNTEEGYCERI